MPSCKHVDTKIGESGKGPIQKGTEKVSRDQSRAGEATNADLLNSIPQLTLAQKLTNSSTNVRPSSNHWTE